MKEPPKQKVQEGLMRFMEKIRSDSPIVLAEGSSLWLEIATMNDRQEVSTEITHYVFIREALSFYEGKEGFFGQFTAWICMNDAGLLLPLNPLIDNLYLKDPSLDTANVKP